MVQVTFGVVPLCHWMYNCWEHTEGVCDPIFFEAAVLMLLMYGAGFAVYLTKLPECFLPGRCDLLFSRYGACGTSPKVLELFCVHGRACVVVKLAWAWCRIPPHLPAIVVTVAYNVPQSVA
jgi:hypothetical protein